MYLPWNGMIFNVTTQTILWFLTLSAWLQEYGIGKQIKRMKKEVKESTINEYKNILKYGEQCKNGKEIKNYPRGREMWQREMLWGDIFVLALFNREKSGKITRFLHLEIETRLGQNHNLEQEEIPGETELPLPSLRPGILICRIVILKWGISELAQSWPHVQLCQIQLGNPQWQETIPGWKQILGLSIQEFKQKQKELFPP